MVDGGNTIQEYKGDSKFYALSHFCPRALQQRLRLRRRYRCFPNTNLQFMKKIRRNYNDHRTKSPYRLVTDQQLAQLKSFREDAIFNDRTAKSKAAFEKAHENLLNGVPMPWMGDWGTEHPIFLERAKGDKCWDIDGNEYVDFCLGDTGAMFGHSPDATADTVAHQVRNGITAMMPTLDSLEIGKELSKRLRTALHGR